MRNAYSDCAQRANNEEARHSLCARLILDRGSFFRLRRLDYTLYHLRNNQHDSEQLAAMVECEWYGKWNNSSCQCDCLSGGVMVGIILGHYAIVRQAERIIICEAKRARRNPRPFFI